MSRSAAPTVADIVAVVGSPAISVVQGGRGLDATVRDVSIVDHLDTSTIAAGAILLGVAVDPIGGHAVGLVDRAVQAGAAGVAFKSDGVPPDRVLAPAARGGLAVLAVPPEMAWGQLYSLLRTALAGLAASDGEQSGGVAIGDLFSFADAVAAAIGAPVTIEDPQWRVLAYSNLDQLVDEPRRQTILGRVPPAEWLQRIETAGVLRALRGGEELVSFEHPDIHTRVVAAVRAGDELLGTIWAVVEQPPLSERAAQELRRAAQRAGVHILMHRSADDIERRRRAALVRDLLEGRSADVVLPPPGAELAAMAVAVAPEGAAAEVNPQRLAAIVGLFVESVDRRAICAGLDGRVWALVPIAPGRGPARLREAAQRIVDRADHVLALPLHVGIGHGAATAGAVPASGEAARRALGVLSRREDGGGAVAHIDDVQEHATLLDLVDVLAARPRSGSAKVVRLAEHDARRGTSYVETLRAWLDAHGDAARAAAACDVHVNTLRYRLRKLAEVGGLDLDDPDERIVVALHLRLLRRDS